MSKLKNEKFYIPKNIVICSEWVFNYIQEFLFLFYFYCAYGYYILCLVFTAVQLCEIYTFSEWLILFYMQRLC
jgi:hypothetical protein